MRALLATMAVLIPIALAACDGSNGEMKFSIAPPSIFGENAGTAVCPGRSTC